MRGARFGQLAFHVPQPFAAVFYCSRELDLLPPQLFCLIPKQANLFRTHRHFALRRLRLTVQLAALPVPIAQSITQRGSFCTPVRHLFEQGVEGFGLVLCDLARIDYPHPCPGQLLEIRAPRVAVPDTELRFQVSLYLLVFLRPSRLSLEVAQARREFADNILGASQIGARLGELALGLLTFALMDRDAGCLFEEPSSFLGPLREGLIDQPLTNDRVCALAEPGNCQAVR